MVPPVATAILDRHSLNSELELPVRAFEIGLVLGSWRSTTDGTTLPFSEIRAFALRAEAMGFDAVWSPDELLGRLVKDGPRYGFWDGSRPPRWPQ